MELSEQQIDQIANQLVQQSSNQPAPATEVPAMAPTAGGGISSSPMQSSPMQMSQPVAPTQEGTKLSDYGKLLGAGGAQVVGGLGWVLNELTDDSFLSLEEAAGSVKEHWLNGMTPAMQESMAKKFVEEKGGELGFGPAVSDPKAILGTIIMSVPSMLPGIGAAGLAGKGAGAIKAVKALGASARQKAVVGAAVVAGSGTEGVIAGASVGQEVEAEVMKAPLKDLMDNELFRATYNETGNIVEARTAVAKKAAHQSAIGAGAVTAILGAPFSATIGRIFTGASRGRGVEAFKGAALESVTEGLQSGNESLQGQVALNEAIGKDMNTADALNNVVGGMAAGGVMGGVMGGIPKPNQQVPESTPAPEVAPTAASIPEVPPTQNAAPVNQPVATPAAQVTPQAAPKPAGLSVASDLVSQYQVINGETGETGYDKQRLWKDIQAMSPAQQAAELEKLQQKVELNEVEKMVETGLKQLKDFADKAASSGAGVGGKKAKNDGLGLPSPDSTVAKGGIVPGSGIPAPAMTPEEEAKDLQGKIKHLDEQIERGFGMVGKLAEKNDLSDSVKQRSIAVGQRKKYARQLHKLRADNNLDGVSTISDNLRTPTLGDFDAKNLKELAVSDPKQATQKVLSYANDGKTSQRELSAALGLGKSQTKKTIQNAALAYAQGISTNDVPSNLKTSYDAIAKQFEARKAKDLAGVKSEPVAKPKPAGKGLSAVQAEPVAQEEPVPQQKVSVSKRGVMAAKPVDQELTELKAEVTGLNKQLARMAGGVSGSKPRRDIQAQLTNISNRIKGLEAGTAKKPEAPELPEPKEKEYKSSAAKGFQTGTSAPVTAKEHKANKAKRKAREKTTATAESDRKTARKVTNTAPTEKQIENETYKKGRVRWEGLALSIENPKGSVRKGTSEEGKDWSQKLAADYGEIKGTIGADGDPIDVFLGADMGSDTVFIINQNEGESTAFDEHKVMIGFTSENAAEWGYRDSYENDWNGLGSMHRATVEEFKAWLDDGDHSQPYEPSDKAPEPEPEKKKRKKKVETESKESKDSRGGKPEGMTAQDEAVITALENDDDAAKPKRTIKAFRGTLHKGQAPTGKYGDNNLFGKGIYLSTSKRDASDYASIDPVINRDLGGNIDAYAAKKKISYSEAKEEMTANGDGEVLEVEFDADKVLTATYIFNDSDNVPLGDALVKAMPRKAGNYDKAYRLANTLLRIKDDHAKILDLLIEAKATTVFAHYARQYERYNVVHLDGPYAPVSVDNSEEFASHYLLLDDGLVIDTKVIEPDFRTPGYYQSSGPRAPKELTAKESREFAATEVSLSTASSKTYHNWKAVLGAPRRKNSWNIFDDTRVKGEFFLAAKRKITGDDVNEYQHVHGDFKTLEAAMAWAAKNDPAEEAQTVEESTPLYNSIKPEAPENKSSPKVKPKDFEVSLTFGNDKSVPDKILVQDASDESIKVAARIAFGLGTNKELGFVIDDYLRNEPIEVAMPLYRELIDYALAHDYKIATSDSVAIEEVRVYEALEKHGYVVEKNKGITLSANDSHIANDGKPVFRIINHKKPAPAKKKAATKPKRPPKLKPNHFEEDTGADGDEHLAPKSAIEVKSISEKAIALVGDTKPHKEEIKAAGGKWNVKHKGWIFPKTRQEQMEKDLSHLLVSDTAPKNLEVIRPDKTKQAGEIVDLRTIPSSMLNEWLEALGEPVHVGNGWKIYDDTYVRQQFVLIAPRKPESGDSNEYQVYRGAFTTLEQAIEYVKNNNPNESRGVVQSVIRFKQKDEKQATKQKEKPEPTKLDKAATAIDTEIDALGKELADLFKAQVTKFNSGVDPQILAVGAKLGALYVGKGVVKFAQWSQAIVNQLKSLGVDSEQIKPALKEMYAATQARVDDDAFDAMDSIRDVRKFDLDSLDLEKSEATPAKVEKSKISLSDYLYENLNEITDNRKLKSILAEYHDTTASKIEAKDLKAAQEAMEVALVKQARETMRSGLDEKSLYEKLVEQYKAQPNLNVRSSTSMENQAYSTPAPIAMIASQFAGIETFSKVYEPTAGNGMLLIGADTQSSVVNELNDDRAANLEVLGYSPTQKDATQFVPGKKKFDAVVMNPPFGKLKDGNGSLAPVKFDDYTISSIDHLIAAKALESMKDNGKAAIIIGASMKAGEIGSADKTFFNWLYSHYNVVEHFEIDGDLYKRQGAGWPIRVIIVHGREASSKITPKSGTIDRLNGWDEIYERYNDKMDAIESGANTGGESNSKPTSQPAAVVEDGHGGATGSNGGETDVANGSGRARRTKLDTKPAGGSAIDGKQPASSQPAKRRKRISGSDKPSQPEVAIPASTTKVSDESTKPKPSGSNRKPKKAITGGASDFQIEYPVRSKGFNDAVLVPKNMADAINKALDNIESSVGKSVDQYVMDKLGYATEADLFKAFMGLQVDSIAAAIYNIETKNKGIIIADQTGVGKGRQAAGIIRYAKRQGKIPIFASVTDNLFTDMYEDLHDIGETNINPFIINNGIKLESKHGSVHSLKGKARKLALTEIVNTGELPAGHDMLFMTYSQINTVNQQRDAIAALNEKAFFVLDESHNAAGEREMQKTVQGRKVIQKTAAGYIYDQLKDKPVVYLSATFAKRPDNMPVYFRTDLMDAVDTEQQLIDAVTSGGVPLQQVMSNMLAESGQLLRRERSFEGIEIPTIIDYENGATHQKQADQVTQGLRSIIEADRTFEGVFFKIFEKNAQEYGGDATMIGNDAKSTIDHNNFNSVVHNYVRQMLLAVKAPMAAQHAIDAFKRNEKPVIALETTMGSFLKEFTEQNDLVVGDVVNFNYKDVLLRALERTRRISSKDEKGNTKHLQISVDKLDPITKKAYKKAEKVINALEVDDLPLSPIDYMRDKLEAAGVRVSEITGRDLRIDYSGDAPVLAKRDMAEQKNKRGTVDKYNNGEIDALVLNRAGSTGLSIHASEKFEDQRPRTMIVAQTMQDINILMQMLGRINRTGQVELPKYVMMGVDLPAEKRPLALTSRKMASLNANTSANDESDTSIKAPDMLNKYGDAIVNEYFKDNMDYAFQLDLSGHISSGDSAPTVGLAMKATGRMALLSVKEQVEIYEDLESAYQHHIDYLTRTGQNDLIAQTLDTDARILSSKIEYEGKAPETIFGGHTTLHKVDVKYQGKPPRPDEVEKALDKGVKGDSAEKIFNRKEGDTKYFKNLEATLKSHEDKLAKENRKLGDDDASNESINAALDDVTNTKERIEAYHLQKTTLKTKLASFDVGAHVRLDLGDDVVTGVVVKLKDGHRTGKGNPYSLSKTRVTIMVNSGIRQVELPLTKLENDAGIYQGHLRTEGKQALDSIYKALEGGAREQRYIATGNLIGGMAKLKGGRIINFTDSSKAVHQGIMMPRKYGKEGEFEAEGTGNIALRDPKVIAQLLKYGGEELEKAGGVFSEKQSVRITGKDGRFKLLVEVANKDSAARAIKFSPAIRELVGDLYSSGRWMSVSFDASKLDKLVPLVTGITPLYSLGSIRQLAEKSGLNTAVEAVKSFDGKQIENPSVLKSKAGESYTKTKGRKISRPAIDKLLHEFVSKYKGFSKDDFIIAGSYQAEVERIGVDGGEPAKGLIDFSGEFGAGSQKVWIFADEHSSLADVERTLRHEALVHKGLSVYSPEHVAQLLTAIAEASKNGKGKLARVWADIEARYGEDEFAKSLDAKGRDRYLAEETMAAIAEIMPRTPDRSWDKIVKAFKAFLKKYTFFDVDMYRYSDVVDQIRDIETAIKAGKETGPRRLEDWAGGNMKRLSSGDAKAASTMMANNIDKVIKASAQLKRNPKLAFAQAGESLKSKMVNLSADTRKHWLGGFTRRQLADYAGSKIPFIKEYVNIAQEMDTWRNELMSEAGGMADRWTAWQGKNKAAARALSKLMHKSTIESVDPSKPFKNIIEPEDAATQIEELEAKIKLLGHRAKKDGESGQAKLFQERDDVKFALLRDKRRKRLYDSLRAEYNALPAEAKAFYNEVRDFYSARHDLMLKELESQIGRSVAVGAQARALQAMVREEFEAMQVEGPYFPLARQGEYFASAAKQERFEFDSMSAGKFKWTQLRDAGHQNVQLLERAGGSVVLVEKREFSLFNSQKDQLAFKEKLEAEGYTVSTGKKLEDLKEIDGVSASFMSSVEDMIGGLGDDPAVQNIRDSIYQMYLDTLPALSMRKNFIHRKKVPGYSEDSARAFASHAFHSSYQLSRLRYGDVLQDKMTEMRQAIEDVDNEAFDIEASETADALNLARDKAALDKRWKEYTDVFSDKQGEKALTDEHEQEGKVLKLARRMAKDKDFAERSAEMIARRRDNVEIVQGEDANRMSDTYTELTKRHEWAMNPQGGQLANVASTVGFSWYLGVSPAAAFVNLTQTPLVAWPLFAAKYGWKDSGAELKKAYGEFMKAGVQRPSRGQVLPGLKKVLTGEELEALEEGYRTGVLDKTLAHDLANIGQDGLEYNPTLNKVNQGVAWAFHNAERVNREVTYMAAYRLARKTMPKHLAIQQAHDLTWDSHFDYSTGNKARFMQGDVAKVVLMFRQFSLNMSYLLGRSLWNSVKGESKAVQQEARKRLTGLLGMHAIFAGAAGMPMYSVITWALEMAFDDEDEPFDADVAFRNALSDTFGKTLGHAISDGPINALTGADIASRVSLDGLWIRGGGPDESGRDAARSLAVAILGPVFGIAQSGLQAAELMSQGETYKAVERGTPKFIRDMMKAGRYANEGVTNRRGDLLLEDVSWWQAAYQAGGLTPAAISQQYERNSALKGMESRIKSRRSLLLNKYWMATRMDDQEHLGELAEIIARFNKYNPEYQLTDKVIQRSLKTRARYTGESINGINLTKSLRHLVDEVRY